MDRVKDPRGTEDRSAEGKRKSPGAAGRADGKAAKAKGGVPVKANASGAKRLRPGELDGLVLAQMRKGEDELPASPATIAKAIGRSSGAAANCLERLVKAKKVRRAKKSHRAYDLNGPG